MILIQPLSPAMTFCWQSAEVKLISILDRQRKYCNNIKYSTSQIVKRFINMLMRIMHDSLII